MAIDTNTNPWAYGAVVLDQRPYLQFFQQQMSQRQAKQDALDNYFRDLGKNVTPAGMRSQDIDGLTQKTNEWRQFYAQNRDAIMNPGKDGGKAYSEYMARYQDQLGYIDQSKNRLKVTTELGKVKLDPNKSYIMDDPSLMDRVALHDKPLNDPSGQELNLMEIVTPPKPWGIKEKEAYSKYLTGGIQYDEVPGTTEYLAGFKTRTPIHKRYSNENLGIIGNRAMSAYDTDRSLQFQANRMARDVMNDEALYDNLNSAFRRVYGKDMHTPKEILAAQSIMDENRSSIEYKEGKDEWGMQNALMAMRQKNAKELIAFKKRIDPNDTEMNNQWVTQYLDRLKSEAKGSYPYEYQYHDGKKVHEYNIPVDPVLGRSLSVNNVEPDAVRVDDNGNFRRIFYKRYEEGDDIPKGKKIGDLKQDKGRVEVDEVLSRHLLSPEQMALALGYRGQTKKDLGETMRSVGGSKVRHPLPQGKPRTVVQGGYTYTYNDETGEYE